MQEPTPNSKYPSVPPPKKNPNPPYVAGLMNYTALDWEGYERIQAATPLSIKFKSPAHFMLQDF